MCAKLDVSKSASDRAPFRLAARPYHAGHGPSN
jgi:hypothetical protein